MKLESPALIAPLLAKPVAVFGGGVSGDGVCLLLSAVGAQGKVYDAKGAAFTDAVAQDHALVVYSPGFVPDHPWLVSARAAGAACLAEVDFASLFWRGEILGITGTNGKTTLTEFLTHALRSIGRDAHATGNIGHSFSRLAAELGGGTPKSIAVCEVSSFQAEMLEHLRPTSVLWTNFAEDHLERHASLEAYFAAKWNLIARALRPQDRAVRPAFVGTSVRKHADKFKMPVDSVVAVQTEGARSDPGLKGTVFAEYPQRENFILAHAWWYAAGLDEEALYAAARSFRLGRHRLTRVAEINGVVYWNDSKGTNFHAVEAALGRFKTPVILIAGGKPKGGDLSGFIRRIGPRVQHVLLIGMTSDELARACEAHHVPYTRCGDLANAVARAAEIAPRGGNVLLSPGFASFDQFRSYEDRGEQFEKLVLERVPSTGVSPGRETSSLR